MCLNYTGALTRLSCRSIAGRCAPPHNPSGKPFCCDICQAVPAAYHPEWDYLQSHTDLWHEYGRGDCESQAEGAAQLEAETPPSMILLACRGPKHCQRGYRAISCRQFPFFPYITEDFRLLGLAYEWEFEQTCWVISHLDQVTDAYRRAFVTFYNDLFSLWMSEMEAYAQKSAEMREIYAARRRRIPILHHKGGLYLLSPASERIERIPAAKLPRFGVYQTSAIS